MPCTVSAHACRASCLGRQHIVTTTESWNPAHRTLIVCDVWDLQHSLNAVRREVEFAPRLNAVVQE